MNQQVTHDGFNVQAHACAEDNSGVVFYRSGVWVARFSYPVGEDANGVPVYEATHARRSDAIVTLKFTCGWEG